MVEEKEGGRYSTDLTSPSNFSAVDAAETHRQRDARPTVTFPATELCYCLVEPACLAGNITR